VIPTIRCILSEILARENIISSSTYYVKNIFRILELRIRILYLYTKFVKQKNSTYIKEICPISQELDFIIKSLKQFNFIERINSGSSLFVGEGNFSFTSTLIKKCNKLPDLIASTYETLSELSEITKNNAKLISNTGIPLMYGVDATKLYNYFSKDSFDTIVFQFPHSGSRELVNGLNPNYVLVYDFIKSSLCILRKNGVILITIVDNDFYNNIFQLETIAKKLGIMKPIKYIFDPQEYSGYEHCSD
jgi:hypothetical protein